MIIFFLSLVFDLFLVESEKKASRNLNVETLNEFRKLAAYSPPTNSCKISTRFERDYVMLLSRFVKKWSN